MKGIYLRKGDLLPGSEAGLGNRVSMQKVQVSKVGQSIHMGLGGEVTAVVIGIWLV